ncbi:MAG TPA: hypothetical protein PLR71_03110 [Deltaproteobacteria bacterium]|nr:hypothetical protein [Deltaproteobacteria bacterium]HQI80527.1 hypothetical protein [Deltaproteobacteria bacterium]
MSVLSRSFSTARTCTVLFLFSILASCGGGGGGGGGGDGGETVVFPDVYNYSLGVDALDPFTISSYNVQDTGITLGTLGPLTGTYAMESGEWSMDAGSLVNVRNVQWHAPDDTFTITVTDELVGTIGDKPDTGSFQVSGGSTPIIVAITAQGVTLNGAAYTWDAYLSLYADSGEDLWKREGALAGLIITLIQEEVAFSADTLRLIETSKATLEIPQDLVNDGSTFPGTPPASLPATGKRTLSWNHAGGDTAVGPGDNFSWSFDWFWSDDPANDIDYLNNGEISLLGLLEYKDEGASEVLITDMGFLPDGASAGGVFYDGFMVMVTEEVSPGVIIINSDDSLVYDGGYSIVFSED